MVEPSPNNGRPYTGLDWLTGFLNRGDCLSALGSAMCAADAVDARVAAFWINLDRFHPINDSFGHLVGDSVLVELARRLERASPASGILARVGGDEFVLVASDGDQADVQCLARELTAAISQPLGVGTRRLRPSVSIGIAVAGIEDDVEEESGDAASAGLQGQRRTDPKRDRTLCRCDGGGS